MGLSHGNYIGDGIFTDEPIYWEGDRGIVHGSYEETHGLVRRKSYEGLSLWFCGQLTESQQIGNTVALEVGAWFIKWISQIYQTQVDEVDGDI